MSLIRLSNAYKDFGIKILFENLNLDINKKDKLGLIGKNGSGKSTLLKIIAGIEPLLSGERTCSSSTKISLASQEDSLNKNKTIIEEVLKGCGDRSNLIIRFQKLTKVFAENPNENSIRDELVYLSELMDSNNAWDLEKQCQIILDKLGIENINNKISELSGGYQKRVGLASALVANPDVLLLDEPTNHLDTIAIQWLEGWLKKYNGAIILITHDRYFLDKVTNQMLEIEKGHSYKYAGNYSEYLKQKIEQENQKELASKKFKTVLNKELSWLKKGAKARSSKQKARIKRIQTMQNKKPFQNENNIDISFLSRRIGNKVINIQNMSIINNNKTILKNFTYDFNPEDRVGIIGPNGCGKSTLLHTIAGIREYQEGNIDIGNTVHIGYLDQNINELNSSKIKDKKVIDFILEVSNSVNFGKKKLTASKLLENFLFSPAEQYNQIEKLSGGEKRRLKLCKILMQEPNVLILDEPTNDFDIQTLSVIENFLEDFQGCVIIVSHDRYFLDRTVDRIFEFNNKQLVRYEGNYSLYLENKKIGSSLEKTSKNNSDEFSIEHDSKKNIFKGYLKSNISLKRKLSFKEKKELENINQKLPLLEKRKSFVASEIENAKTSLIMSSLSEELAKIIEEIEKLEERWLILSDI